MHTAAQFGDLDFLKQLLARNANPNARTAKAPPRTPGGGFFRIIGEQTPLMLAARANQLEAMRALMAGGADPTLKAQDGNTDGRSAHQILSSFDGQLRLEPGSSGAMPVRQHRDPPQVRANKATTAGNTIRSQ